MTNDVEPGASLPTVGEPVGPEPVGAAAPSLAPVAVSERIESLDVLRGFALLGILVMNIVAFSLPDAAYGNPTLFGSFDGADRAAWLFSHLFFELKMMTIFSMLFGAGLVLMAERASARGGSVGRVYYRRILWLLAIGLVHAYFVWWGDILTAYAECGLLLYLFRRRPPRTLVLLGLGAMLVAIPTTIGIGHMMAGLRATAAEAEAALAAGKTREELSVEQREALAEWDKSRRQFAPTSDQIAEELWVYRDGYREIFRRRAPNVFMFQTVFFVFFIGWRVGGAMLLGMGLMKLGVFTAQRTTRFYGWCVALGYGLGLPLAAWGASRLISHQFDPIYAIQVGGLFNYVGSLAVAMGHVGLVMLAWRSGVGRGLQKRLAAVGQMALTNYLMHSLICTTLFYGYGLGLFGRLGRAQLLGVVAAIWVFQLVVSPLWLARFRFGPAEWLWRSLTYGRRQPMRLAASAPAA